MIRDIIHEWNSVHSEDKNVVLMPVGWDTHAKPEMGDRPQELLNRQILAVATASSQYSGHESDRQQVTP